MNLNVDALKQAARRYTRKFKEGRRGEGREEGSEGCEGRRGGGKSDFCSSAFEEVLGSEAILEK